MSKQLRILVLGGQGFIGSHLVEALLNNGSQVRSFDRPGVISINMDIRLHPNFELIEGDFLNDAEIHNALVGCDVCYHLISTTNPKSSNDNPVFDVESNILGTVRLLSYAVKVGIKKVIFVSSGGTVYGVPSQIPISENHSTDPICSYGISKLAIEKYLDLFHKLYGLDYSVLRVANPYGGRQQTNKGQGAIAVFLEKALSNEAIEIWGDGSVIRDYIYIDDVVSALLAAAKYVGEEHVFNIGGGSGLSLNNILDAIDLVSECPTIRRYTTGRVCDVSANVLSIERAKQELGWSPSVSFEVGLKRFCKSLKQSLVCLKE